MSRDPPRRSANAERAALLTSWSCSPRSAASVSSVIEPDRGWKVHVADSLTGLEFAALRDAKRIADIGAGAGFPGLPLAVALPGGARST